MSLYGKDLSKALETMKSTAASDGNQPLVYKLDDMLFRAKELEDAEGDQLTETEKLAAQLETIKEDLDDCQENTRDLSIEMEGVRERLTTATKHLSDGCTQCGHVGLTPLLAEQLDI